MLEFENTLASDYCAEIKILNAPLTQSNAISQRYVAGKDKQKQKQNVQKALHMQNIKRQGLLLLETLLRCQHVTNYPPGSAQLVSHSQSINPENTQCESAL